jgi:drug/metabolite transporter (DMT)-like permease
MAESGRRPLVSPRLQALFVTFLWSTSWVLIKLGLEEIPAFSFAGLRYTLAFLFLAPVLAARPALRAQLRRLRLSDWLRLAFLGVVFYSLAQGAQFLALAFLPAVTLSLILSFTPAAVALLGAVLLGERLTRSQCVGLACFLLGAALYFLPLRAPLQTVGLGVAAVCLMANSGASIVGRAVNRRGDLHPLLVTVVSMGVGSMLLMAVAFAVEGVPRLNFSGWAIVLWLAAVNTALAFTIWNHTLRSLTAIESTLINNTMLVQIAVLAWLFLGEPISGREGAGLVMAVVGVLLVQLAGVRRPTIPGYNAWMDRLQTIKVVHTLVWAFFASCIVAIPALAWRGHTRAAAVLIGVVFLEVAVLAVNRWRCPLTGVAARYTDDRRDNFDIYLPEWIARHNKTIFGGLYLAGIVMTLALWAG